MKALIIACMGMFPLPAMAQDELEGGWILYPPVGEGGLSQYCEMRLIAAERAMARMMTDFSYTLSISASGQSDEYTGASCSLDVTRTATIKSTGQEK